MYNSSIFKDSINKVNLILKLRVHIQVKKGGLILISVNYQHLCFNILEVFVGICSTRLWPPVDRFLKSVSVWSFMRFLHRRGIPPDCGRTLGQRQTVTPWHWPAIQVRAPRSFFIVSPSHCAVSIITRLCVCVSVIPEYVWLHNRYWICYYNHKHARV